ncbi:MULTISPECIES: cupin domain-containing protein [Sphingobacterium]|uniref:Cupin domain-containing protein n=1 Tax=Sphingobacterium populi TaxID=1812824 RepID=A0ABW5UHN6_9SPHI|nr:cupin domain-containing protein [Sphingobacterium sp. CFCC 11742]
MIRDISNTQHYQWGDACDGWHLVESETLSVIQEKMPSGTSESAHYHHKAQQFFYILKGIATFDVGDQRHYVAAGKGFHILPEVKHQISNLEEHDLEFIVVSEPKSHGDRINT